MPVVTIKPDTRTKISDGSCSIYSGGTQLITLTDPNGSVIETTYANGITPIASEGAVYAKSHDRAIKITVSGLQPIEQVQDLVVGTQAEIDAINPKRADTMYVVVE